MHVGRVKRWREQRLRSRFRHERQTVAMELAAALHHSRDGRRETYDGLRAQKTASSGGQRPGVLTEPEPQWEAVTVGHVAAPVPSLAVPLLAGAAGEAGVVADDTTVSFLLAENLKLQKEVKEERRRKREEAEHEARMQEVDRRVQADVPLIPGRVSRVATSSPWRRGEGKRGTRRNCPNPLPHAPFALGNLDIFFRAPCLPVLVRCLRLARGAREIWIPNSTCRVPRWKHVDASDL